MPDFVHLTDDDLEALDIAPAEVADAVEAAIRAKAEGRLLDAPKAALMPGEGRYMMATLAVGTDNDLTVVKQVTVSPDNADRGLPGINGAIMVLDARTGLLRALMGANWITGARTAALSAVAARRLADPAARSIAFVGCGTQAHTHLDAFRRMFPLAKVRAFGRGRARVEAFCDHARGLGLAATAPATAQAALEDADIVVSSITLDFSVDPFLDARWLKPGAFATITDLAIPWHPETMETFSRIVIDDRAQEAAMEKKMVDPASVTADLTEIVTGTVPVAHDPARPAAFVFRGVALGDYAAAALALARAESAGAGRRLPI